MRGRNMVIALAILVLTIIGGVAESQTARPSRARDAVGSVLRSGEIRTRHYANGSVTSGKLGLVTIAVTVTAGSPSATTAASAPTVGGTVLGCVPSGNQDQFIDNVAVNVNGGLTVTLAANATANNTFNCRVLKADALGVQ